MRRSLLFIPANNPNMLANAGLLGADSVIFDLEDAVAPQEKDAARILLRNALKYLDFFGTEIIVRINALDTPYWEQDLKAIVPLKPAMCIRVVVTKELLFLCAPAQYVEGADTLGRRLAGTHGHVLTNTARIPTIV